MPSKPAPRNPANRPPRNPGRLRKPPTGEDVGGRCANVPPGWLGCVMLRSMGRALGDVAVDGGAEKVCEPRLPKPPPRPARASASVIANANTATTAPSASSGRKRRRSMGGPPRRPFGSTQILVAHGSIVRGATWCRRPMETPAQRRFSRKPRVTDREMPFGLKAMGSVVLAVLARLGRGERAGAPFLERAGRGAVRGERAGDATIALARVARGTRGHLLSRHGVRIAGAMAIAPAHQIDVDMVVVIDVRARRQHRAEFIAGRRLHVAQNSLLLGQTGPTVFHRDLTSVR